MFQFTLSVFSLFIFQRITEIYVNDDQDKKIDEKLTQKLFVTV